MHVPTSHVSTPKAAHTTMFKLVCAKCRLSVAARQLFDSRVHVRMHVRRRRRSVVHRATASRASDRRTAVQLANLLACGARVAPAVRAAVCRHSETSDALRMPIAEASLECQVAHGQLACDGCQTNQRQQSRHAWQSLQDGKHQN